VRRPACSLTFGLKFCPVFGVSFFAAKDSEVLPEGFDIEDFALSASVSLKPGSEDSYFKPLWKPGHLLDNEIIVIQLLPAANHESIHE
jgi:hypothetical protein